MVGIVPDPSQTKEHDTSTNHDTLTKWHEELLRRAGADVSSVLDRVGFATPGATHSASEIRLHVTNVMMLIMMMTTRRD